MLIDFDYGGKTITKVPFQAQYATWLRLLAQRIHPLAIQSTKQWIHAELTDGIMTTSWVAGVDWWGTPYLSLYDALQDQESAAMFFGLISCDCVLERCQATRETWGYGHYKRHNLPIKGRTYFRIP